MKKIPIICFLVSAVLFSCKKDREEIAPPGQGILKKDPLMGDKSISMPGTALLVGQHVYTAGTNEPVEINAEFEGTASRSAMSNLRVVFYRSAIDSVILTDNAVVNGRWPNDIPVQRGTSYTIRTYVATQSIPLGTLIVKLQVYQGNDQTPLVPGQVITFSPYKTAPTVSAQASTTLTANGTTNEYEVVIGVQGSIAIKGPPALAIEFADNGVNDTIKVHSLRMIHSGVDETVEGTFVDSLGFPVDTLSELVARHRKLYFVYTAGAAEKVISGTHVYKIQFVVSGLGNSGDAVRLTWRKDAQALPSGWTYFNKGTSGLHPKAYNTASANSNARVVDFLFSDLSAVGHSGIPGLSSPDWFNSYTLTWNVAPAIFHSRIGN